MSVGELWHYKLHVAADGTAQDLVIELPSAWYLAIANAIFVQKATNTDIPDSSGILAPDSSGGLLLRLDDATLDYSGVQLGAVQYTEEPIYEYPHDITKPDHIVVGETIHGLKAGVAVINTPVYIDGDVGELKLVTELWNTTVVNGGISVLEVSVPPSRAVHFSAVRPS